MCYIAVTETKNMVTALYITNLDGCYLVIYNCLHCKTMLGTPRLSHLVLLLYGNEENSVMFSSSGKLRKLYLLYNEVNNK